MKDKLQILLEKQSQLINFISNRKEWYKRATKEEFLFVMTYALIDEAVEFIHELNWKPWKGKHLINYEKLKEELIDILHFWLTLAVELNLTAEDIVEIYTAKNKVNVNRQLYDPNYRGDEYEQKTP